MKKRFLLLLIPFLFISHVKANEAVSDLATNGQIGQWQIPLAAQCFNSSFDSVNTSWNNNYIDVGGVDGKDYFNCNFGTDGLISITTNQLTDSNKLYSLVLFIGNSYGLAPNAPTEIGLGSSTYVARNDIVYSGNNGTMWSSRVSNKLQAQQPGEDAVGTLSYYAVYVVFSSKSNSTSIAIHLSYPSPVISTWIFGYELNYIGNTDNLSKSDVENALSNSGLATASSVNEVNKSVNEVKQEISGMKEEQKKTNEELKKTNDTLNNDDVTDSTNKANEFFNGFTTDTHGLTSIITAPLSLISSITSKSCSPLVLPLPYVDKDLSLPCMGAIYSNYFGSFLSVYQVITFGIVAYWVCVRIFNLVKDFKNPDHDEIEVLDL